MELSSLQKTIPRLDIGEGKTIKDTKSAAREFEAVLIGEMLNSAFSPEQMGLGDDMDSGAQTMLDFGREHLSRVISDGGGLGLAKLIESGLTRDTKRPGTASLKP